MAHGEITRFGQLDISHVRTPTVLTVALHGLPRSAQANAGKMRQIWPQPLPSACFSRVIHYLIVLHINLCDCYLTFGCILSEFWQRCSITHNVKIKLFQGMPLRHRAVETSPRASFTSTVDEGESGQRR